MMIKRNLGNPAAAGGAPSFCLPETEKTVPTSSILYYTNDTDNAPCNGKEGCAVFSGGVIAAMGMTVFNEDRGDAGVIADDITVKDLGTMIKAVDVVSGQRIFLLGRNGLFCSHGIKQAGGNIAAAPESAKGITGD
ncbi:MAG: hypothetical protein LBD31_05750 [Treponema sp.]|jgi:hypothetical protein|nr:hypothetical protein [Treponema sp.]